DTGDDVVGYGVESIGSGQRDDADAIGQDLGPHCLVVGHERVSFATGWAYSGYRPASSVTTQPTDSMSGGGKPASSWKNEKPHRSRRSCRRSMHSPSVPTRTEGLRFS